MTAQLAATLQVWRSRNVRSRADHAYAAYMALMVGLAAVAPTVRALWLGASSPQGVSLLASPDAAGVTAVTVSGLWASSLLLGRVRGPALRPPFLAYALGGSGLPRWVTFRGPLIRGSAITTALTTAGGVLIGTALVARGHSDASDAVLFVLACSCVGMIASVAWLTGQAMPRTAAWAAPIIVGLGALTGGVPALSTVTPWGWVGLLYPNAPSPTIISMLPLLPLLALTSGLVAAVPLLMSRLTLRALIAQATRWENATAHATSMELAAATTVYQATPRVGRTLRTIRPRLRGPAVFLLRDAIGAARTPVRLGAGVLALAVAGAIFSLSLVAESPSWALGAVAGVILFAGLGPLTDGIRHAAQVASDLPLYGISDERLLASHALFPLLATVTVLAAVSTIGAGLAGGVLPAVLGSLTLAILAITTRIASAVKGPLPPTLLAPIPTPMGDLGAVVRLLWALDGILLAAAAGASAALAFSTPVPLLGVGTIVAMLTARRWRQRA